MKTSEFLEIRDLVARFKDVALPTRISLPIARIHCLCQRIELDDSSIQEDLPIKSQQFLAVLSPGPGGEAYHISTELLMEYDLVLPPSFFITLQPFLR